MAAEETKDLAPEETGGKDLALSRQKGRRAFRKVTRELTDADLANPAVQRLLLDDLDRLETERDDLSQSRDKFHEADKRVGILEAKAQVNIAFEIISSGCLAAGSATVGYARTLWDTPPNGVFALGLGCVLVIVGIVAKVVKR